MQGRTLPVKLWAAYMTAVRSVAIINSILNGIMNPRQPNRKSFSTRRNVYDAPELYQMAYSYRNIKAEVSALIRWFKKNSGARKTPAAVLELASGPADHAIEFAKRGISATALDISQTMCRFARRQARQRSVSLKTVNEDMIGFSLKHRYDLVITMIDSINQIHAAKDMIKHLRSVAACLAENGLYVIELAKHEKEGEQLQDVQWSVRRQNKKLRVVWRPLTARANGKSYKVSLELTADTERGRLQLADVLNVRTWSPKDIERLVKKSGCFRIAARYANFREDVRPSDREAINCILMLRKLPNVSN